MDCHTYNIILHNDRLEVFESIRYVHRLSISDKELYYMGIVWKK